MVVLTVGDALSLPEDRSLIEVQGVVFSVGIAQHRNGDEHPQKMDRTAR